MFINKNYKRDINYVYELNRFVFRLAGVWPYARTKSWFPDTLERIIVIFFSYVVLLCELVPGIFYMILIKKEFRTTLKVAAPVIFNLMSVIKYSQLLLSMNEVKNCLVQVEEDWKNVANSSDRDIMINKTKTGRRLLLICGIFMYTTGLSFRTIIPLSRGKTITPQNLTIRHLPCPAYFILFDVQLSPAYEIVFFIQFFTGFVKCTITTAVCGIAGLCVMHICAQLEILMILMNNLVNDVELKNINENLAIVVKYQIKMRK